MGWINCTKHSGYITTITTPAIWEAIENGTDVPLSQLCFLYIRVIEESPYARYVFDKPFLEKLGIKEAEKFTILTEDAYEDERGKHLFDFTAGHCKACVEDFCERTGFKWEMSTQGDVI